MARYNKAMKEKCKQAALLQHQNMSQEDKLRRNRKISEKIQSLVQLNPKMGHHISHRDEIVKKMSTTIQNQFLNGRTIWNKGKKFGSHTREHKRKIRESLIQYVETVRLKGKPLYPCVGLNEKQILDSLEEKYNFPIQRQYRVAGFFLDGYIPELNIAFEVDEEYHFENGKLSVSDIRRQQEIEDELKCQFVRIKA